MNRFFTSSASRVLAAALAVAAAVPMLPAQAELQTGGPWASFEQQQRILERQMRQQTRRRDRLVERQMNGKYMRMEGRRSRK